MTCYAMTFWEFRPIVETDARIAWKLVQALAHKLREADAAPDLVLFNTKSRPSATRSSRARAGSPESATVSDARNLRLDHDRRRRRSVFRAERRATSPGALPSAVVASTRPSPVTTRS